MLKASIAILVVVVAAASLSTPSTAQPITCYVASGEQVMCPGGILPPAQRADRRSDRKHERRMVSVQQDRQPGGGVDPWLVQRARQYVGDTAREVGVRKTLWCSAFLRKVAGDAPGIDDRAASWLKRPRVRAQVGAIVVLSSRRTHVGVVSGFDANGNPVVISGNHGNRVAEATYPRSRVIAYVQPPNG